MSEQTDTTIAPEPAASPPPRPATPAIDAIGGLFDMLADRHIEAHRVSRKAPFGITKEMLADFWNRRSGSVSADELAAVTPELAKQILFERVWRPLMADKLPEPVACLLFDVAIKRGQERAAKTLQKAIGEGSRMAMKIDGRIGQETLRAVADLDPVHLAEQIFNHRSKQVWRLGDGKILGGDLDLGRAAIFAGRALLKAKTAGLI